MAHGFKKLFSGLLTIRNRPLPLEKVNQPLIDDPFKDLGNGRQRRYWPIITKLSCVITFKYRCHPSHL